MPEDHEEWRLQENTQGISTSQSQRIEKWNERIRAVTRATTRGTADYITPESWQAYVKEQTAQYVVSAQQARAREYDERGLPVDWVADYQNQRYGPWGEELPALAEGWTPLGKPDYGPGLGGIWDHIRSNFTRPDEGAEGPTGPRQDPQWLAGLGESNRLLEEGDFGKAFAKQIETHWNYMTKTIVRSWQWGEERPLIKYPYRLIGAGLTGAIDFLNWVTHDVAQVAVGPNVLASDEIVRRGYAARGEELPEWVQWLKEEPIGKLGVVIYNPWAVLKAKQFISEGYATAEEKAELKQQYEAAAYMAYTAWREPAARDEAVRRVQAGEDPRLVAMDLGDPASQLAGELIYDPVNFIGMIKGTIKFLRAPKALPATAFNVAVSDDLARGLSQIGSAVTEDVARSQLDDILRVGREVFDGARSEVTDFATHRGAFVPTAGGKTVAYNQRGGQFLYSLTQHFRNDPDGLMNCLEGMVMFADPVDDVARLEGLMRLSETGLESRFLFSQAGVETAIFYRNLLVNEAGDISAKAIIDAIEGAGDDAVKLTDDLWRINERAYQGVFPDIQEQVAQHAEYLGLLDESADEAAEYLLRHPAADKPIGRATQAIANSYEFAQKIFYRPTANIQGVLYMGTNPVYVVKNRWGNTMPILVDVGVEPAVKSLLGKVGPLGFSPQGSLDELSRWGGGIIPEGASRGIGPIGSAVDEIGDGILHPASRQAATDEAGAAANLMASKMREHMQRYLRNGIAYDLSMLNFLPDEQVMLIDNLIYQHHGNVDEAFDALRAADGFPVGRNLGFLDTDVIKNLQDYNLYDELTRVLTEADDYASYVAGSDDIYRAYRQGGLRTATEASILDVLEGNAQKVAVEIENALSTNLGDEAGDAFTRMTVVNEHAQKLAASAADEIQDLARYQMYDTWGRLGEVSGVGWQRGIRQGGDYIENLLRPFTDKVDELTDEAVEEARRFTASTWEHSDWAYRRSASERASKWIELGIPGTPPTNCTLRQFRDALWDTFYRPTQRGRFTDLREVVIDVHHNRAFALTEQAGIAEAEIQARFGRATAANVNARMFDGAQMVRGEMFVDVTVGNLEDAVVTQWQALTDTPGGTGLQDMINSFRAQGTSGADALRWMDQASKDALRAMGDPEEVLDFLIKNPPGAAPGTIRIYQGRPVGFIEEAGESLWYSDKLNYAEDFAGPGGQVVYQDVPQKAWQEAMEGAALKRAATGGLAEPTGLEGLLQPEYAGRAASIDEITEATLRMPVVTPADAATPSAARLQFETTEQVYQALEEVKAGVQDNWDTVTRLSLTGTQERAVADFIADARAKITTVRAVGFDVSTSARDFALHHYGKRLGIDLALGMIYPYQFWHSRSYVKWMKRLVQNPQIISAYAHYRQFLESKHAGLPEWWRYNMNTNELLGLNSENPLWFNLEQTLNPLYGLTGVDFNDPRRRMDWWSGLVDDLNKFGPSVWTPFQIGLAFHYMAQGEQEAASRWAGRLWQPTRAIRDITALLGMRGGKGIEIDPLINFFSGGVGPYERARAARMLGAMQSEGRYSAAEIAEAGYSQNGPAWDEAITRSIHQRAPDMWQIAAPFLLGTGFKPRTQHDIDIDRMYGEMYGLMAMRADMPLEEYRTQWGILKENYPFMDNVLMARKSGPERDEALAWNVLNRIPPGYSDELAERVGLDRELLNQWYDNKGDIQAFDEADRMLFMGGILKLSALLEVPDEGTREDWEDARTRYRLMTGAGEQMFGDNIWAQVDAFYASEDKDSFLRSNPVVEQVLDWRSSIIMSDPDMAPYYTSIEKITQYYKGLMYTEAEERFGEDLWDHFEVWGRLSDISNSAARRYWREHSQLAGYKKFKDDNMPMIAALIAEVSYAIPEARPPVYREPQPVGEELKSMDKEGWLQAQVESYLAGAGDVPQMPANLSPEQLQQALGDSGYNLLMDYIYRGEDLPEALRAQLEAMGLGDLIE